MMLWELDEFMSGRSVVQCLTHDYGLRKFWVAAGVVFPTSHPPGSLTVIFSSNQRTENYLICKVLA